MFVPVLLSGGSGSRLWPESRASYPKQFINLISEDHSPLQQTATRLEGFDLPHSGWVVVANEDHRFLVAEQLRAVDAKVDSIILEPCKRDTTAAIALAALDALSRFDDPVLLVQTSDHWIPDTRAFQETVKKALQLQASITTFGIKPTRPETGYGYIKTGKPVGEDSFLVEQFVEKPDLETATGYLQDGSYVWNSGMFLLNAKAFLAEVLHLQPDLHHHVTAAFEQASKDMDFTRVDATQFEQVPAISVDFAIMEKAQDIHVVEFSAAWSDLGSWDAIPEMLEADANGNCVQGDAVIHDSRNTFVRSGHRLVTAIGVRDLAIVETNDAVLVAAKSEAQNLKKLVQKLETQGRTEAHTHLIGHRPWGTY